MIPPLTKGAQIRAKIADLRSRGDDLWERAQEFRMNNPEKCNSLKKESNDLHEQARKLAKENGL